MKYSFESSKHICKAYAFDLEDESISFNSSDDNDDEKETFSLEWKHDDCENNQSSCSFSEDDIEENISISVNLNRGEKELASDSCEIVLEGDPEDPYDEVDDKDESDNEQDQEDPDEETPEQRRQQQRPGFQPLTIPPTINMQRAPGYY